MSTDGALTLDAKKLNSLGNELIRWGKTHDLTEHETAIVIYNIAERMMKILGINVSKTFETKNEGE